MLEKAAAVPSTATPLARAPQEDKSWLAIFCEILDSLISAPVIDEALSQQPATTPDEEHGPGVEDTAEDRVLPMEAVGKPRLQGSSGESLAANSAESARQGSDAALAQVVMLSSPAPNKPELPIPVADTGSSLPDAPPVEAPVTAAAKPGSALTNFCGNASMKAMITSTQPVALGRHIFQLLLRIPQARPEGGELNVPRSAVIESNRDDRADAAPGLIAPESSEAGPGELAQPEELPHSASAAGPDQTPPLSPPEAKPPETSASAAPADRLPAAPVDAGPVGGIAAVLNPPFALAAPPVSADRAPATHHQPSTQTTPAPTSESLEPARKPTSGGYVQNIGVLVRSANQVVRLQIHQSDGSVRVSVHADDPRLAELLRDSLPQLVKTLDQQGYQPRVALPQTPAAAITLLSETAKTDVRSGADGNSDSSAYNQPRQQRQRNPRHAWQELAFQLHE